jgi:hypothetical protein
MGILNYATSVVLFFLLAKMIKTTLATVAIAALAPVGAIAGPYVNIETNAGWTGSQYGGAATDIHLGYEGTAGAASYYIQGGPQVQLPNGGDSETVFSGKAGAGFGLTEKLNAYGEVSVVTAGDTDQNGYGGKVGVKYNF